MREQIFRRGVMLLLAAVIALQGAATSAAERDEKPRSLARFSSLYKPSDTNYARKYPVEFRMLYALLKDTFDRKELEDILNRQPTRPDEMHLKKIRFLAVPDSLEQQRQKHINCLPALVNDATLQEGLQFFGAHKNVIMKAYAAYHVKPEDILAIIHWESQFGRNKGAYCVYRIFAGSLFNLSEVEAQLYREGAYIKKGGLSRGEALARIERLKKRAALNLAALLRLAAEKNFNPYEVKGSWAGAIGIPQFMPSSMIFAADGNGDGVIDLDDMDDAIFSVANFLHEHSYAARGFRYSLKQYNPEDAYVRGVSLYSSRLVEKGLVY